MVRAAAGERLDREDAEMLRLTFGEAAPAEMLARAETLDAAAIDADLRAGRAGGALAVDLGDDCTAPRHISRPTAPGRQFVRAALRA
jgi:hypothetical protein